MDPTIDSPARPQPATEPMLPDPWRVERVHAETADTFSLELTPVGGPRPLAFSPGQFNMLYVFGVGEVPISISGNPEIESPLVHTTRVVGTVTRAMGKLKAGDLLGVRGPYGSGWPVDAAKGRDVVIVAGGLGLAPLRPLIHHLLAHRADYREIALLYGTRTPQDRIFRADLRRWTARRDLQAQVTVDRAVSGWTGHVGVVTKLVAHAPFDPSNTVAFVCGPEVMMRFTLQELQRRGVPPERSHLSLERNMKCAIGFCGHCQYGSMFVCKDGPVFRYDRVRSLMKVREL